ncbi:XRE family transcriptional regulator [Streptomyces sp. SID8350]|nr:XRE family transcriptional regulator [Streptomyces sp. SID8350]
MAKSAHYSVATLAEAARGLQKPSLKVTLAYVTACGGDVPAWVRRWHDVSEELEAEQSEARRKAEPVAREPTRPGRPAVAPHRSMPYGIERVPRQETGPAASRAAPASHAASRAAGRGQDALTADERDELRRLRDEVAELRRANEVLKAASAIFAADLRTTAQVVYNPAGRQDRSA